VIGDRVECEVAASQVFVDGRTEGYDSVATVGLDVASKGRDLVHGAIAIEHPHGAEFDPHRYCPWKETADLRRSGGGCQVPVQVWVAKEGVSHGASHAPGLEALVLEPFCDVENGSWRGERGHCEGVGNGRSDVYVSTPMNMEPLLAVSGATDEFKASVRQYSTHGKAPLVEAAGFAPPIKVLRVLAQLLDVEPTLRLGRVRVEGYAGCSDFRGSIEAHIDGRVRQWSFVWCCRWRASEEGWVDCFGFPDQMRAAREFGFRCFERWVESPAPGGIPTASVR